MLCLAGSGADRCGDGDLGAMEFCSTHSALRRNLLLFSSIHFSALLSLRHRSALIACYQTYDYSIAAIKWPAAAADTVQSLRADIQAIDNALSSGGDVNAAVAKEIADSQELDTTLSVLKS